MMKIAVLSGKGGTGKTTVATNLALALGADYVDCDVEEPNGFIFLKPDLEEKFQVKIKQPVIDESKCISCGACVEACQFNSLGKAGGHVLLFEKLCHSCLACQVVCSQGAITFDKRSIGTIEKGRSHGIRCLSGRLNIGEPMAVPIIKELVKATLGENTVYDCSPGTSCNVVQVLRHVDRAIVVTEPTVFGLHDMKMAVTLLRKMEIPYGVVVNKDQQGDQLVTSYCHQNEIPIIGRMTYSKKVAKVYSRGALLYDDSFYKRFFDHLAEEVKEVLL